MAAVVVRPAVLESVQQLVVVDSNLQDMHCFVHPDNMNIHWGQLHFALVVEPEPVEHEVAARFWLQALAAAVAVVAVDAADMVEDMHIVAGQLQHHTEVVVAEFEVVIDSVLWPVLLLEVVELGQQVQLLEPVHSEVVPFRMDMQNHKRHNYIHKDSQSLLSVLLLPLEQVVHMDCMPQPECGSLLVVGDKR